MFAKVSDKLHRRHTNQQQQGQQGKQEPGFEASRQSQVPGGRTGQPPELSSSSPPSETTLTSGFGAPKLPSPLPVEQPSNDIIIDQENQVDAPQPPSGYDTVAYTGDVGTPHTAQPAIMNELSQNVAGASNHYMAFEKAEEAQKQVSRY